MVILLAVFLVFVFADTRYPLPRVNYAREPNPAKQTPLDKFVWTYDDTAGYAQYSAKQYSGNGWTGYILDFNSGLWQKAATSSRPLWQHWLTICVPENLTQKIATLYIDGPGNSETPDSQLNPPIYMICNGNTGGLTVYLQQVPNEDISFPGNPNLGEDALIAYAWRQFLDGGAKDPTWLPRLPMTRAASSAMTAVQDWFARTFPKKIQPTGFLVAGASKRGWTTWTTAAVDTRVVAAVPIVMPIGQVVPNIAAEWRAYGNWSFALKDYVHYGIVNYLFTQPIGLQAIADIVDPIVYMDRYTMPVWNIIACGDEFTLPDSPRFWWHKLPGEKHLRAMPNAEHSMACCVFDLVSDIISFYHMLVANVTRPSVKFQLVHSGSNAPASITLTTSQRPESATMWYATTGPERRDFRLVVCFDLPRCLQPVIWLPKKLTPKSVSGNSVTYVAEQGAPAEGWTGFLVMVDFLVNIPGLSQPISWRVSTEVNVVPDTFPFAPCPPSECNNPPNGTNEHK